MVERMNKTYPSPVKIISVEKIIMLFTFEKTYCRIGVVTENDGIERMEAYFVRNDKTAICYKNSLFYQVVIDDARHNKYDDCEINIGTIISIRTTTGLANYIIKFWELFFCWNLICNLMLGIIDMQLCQNECARN